MSDENKQDFKKNFPNGFIWFLMAAFLLALMVQNLIDTKFAKVSFNYQLEHLVNQDLIQPEDSRKTAVDNLVTFSGKFRDRLTEEGKRRYKFLELLNTNHELEAQKQQLDSELVNLAEKAVDASDLFLLLSGIPLAKDGYIVVDDLYHSQDKDNSIVVRTLPKQQVPNLVQIEKQLADLKKQPDEADFKQFGISLSELVRNFRSPTLGIGNEMLKQNLRQIDQELTLLNQKTDLSPATVAKYESLLSQLRGIVTKLDHVEDNLRLSELRGVRNYNIALGEYNNLMKKLDENQAQLDKARQAVAGVIWFFNNKELSTRSLEKQDPELYHQWFTNAKEEWNNFAHNRGGIFKAPDQPLNTVLEKTFRSEEPTPNYMSYLFTILPVLLVAFLLYFIFSRQMKGMGANAMNFGKSPAKLMAKGTNKVTFKDVAGIDDALEELQEIVEFLRSPQKFTALGGHIPKGVLCIGPPGTGKTLIAKAVAGEADRPFFSISGSDFVEMFVGVGASRIRDMFDQAKKSSPCIIFIDEIDAVGRHRGAGIGGGHDEREQTLNQLLVEMDGFDTNDGVILMAATNRPDVLDKALLRPGRFDRRVMINLPDIKGRFDILKVHAKKIKMDASVDLMMIARSTPGASGADLANLLNEAALLAARRGRTAVTAAETVEARDKVLYGKERRNLEMDDNERKSTAYHEAGHTVVGFTVEHSDPVDKVTIIPRGYSLGATMFLPKKNRTSYWKKELIDQLAVLMGGRCAEEIFLSDLSSGARQDIERATQLARSMVCEFGMSEKLGSVAYDDKSESSPYFGAPGHSEKKYSEETARLIDAEVKRILDDANEQAKEIILRHKEEIELMALMLMEFETLDSEDVRKILNKEWSVDDKRERLKRADDLHKRAPSSSNPSDDSVSPRQSTSSTMSTA
ncbi:MAG: cell division protein FtsH [Parachlamydia sp.]|nr:MAG: cell division protein FtsH [Parachlamydia sp.]